MKLLSDFDGVWTDQALEAEHVKIYLIAEAARLARRSADQAREDFAAFEQVVRATPHAYGWAPDGRITAYVDEDPFCVPNAIAAYLTQSDDPRAAPYRDGVLDSEELDSGGGDLNAFADRCFLEGMRSFRDQHPPALVANAADVVRGLHAAGVDVVVVSNSPAEKIAAWFRQSGIDAGTTADHAVRIRGQAGKQTLGPTDEWIELAGRRIHVDRPLYRQILLEEDPDVVVGDVFSLDLALPFVLRSQNVQQAPRELVLRRHPHTPTWVRGLAASGVLDHVVDDVSALVEICS